MNQNQKIPMQGRSTSELVNLIPHRPPMVWVDEVLSFGPEGGECLVRLKKTNLYFSNGKLRPSSLVEFISQSQIFIGLCQRKTENLNFKIFKNLYLLSITDANFKNPDQFPEIQRDMYLIIKVGLVRIYGNFQLFSGSVCTSEGNLLGSSSIKALAEN